MVVDDLGYVEIPNKKEKTDVTENKNWIYGG